MEENIEKFEVEETTTKEKIKELKELKKEVKGDNKKIKCLEKELESIKIELEKTKKELILTQEKALRANAEMMNFKRRKEEETSYMLKYASEDVIKSLLPVIDNFERGIKLDDNDLSDEVSKFLSGFKMIYSNFVGILNKFEVKEIEANGVEFDPNYHQAVLMEHDENKPSGVVIEVLQKGYMYKDKVIRPAMVKVNE